MAGTNEDADKNAILLMSFLLDISTNHLSLDLSDGLPEIFKVKPDIRLHLRGDDYEFMSWGDPISTDKFSRELPRRKSLEFIVNNLYGHYYFAFYDRADRKVITGNSLFSILPLYYCEWSESGSGSKRIMMSENVFTLASHLGKKSFSKRFLLESMLFNYPLFNHSAVDGIKLLPSNSGIIADRNGAKILKHTSVEKLFGQHNILSVEPSRKKDGINLAPARKEAETMVEIFLQETKKYLPEQDYYTALTGGFDGRTLTAVGLYHKRPFSGFCFGTASSLDLNVARLVSSKAGISFFGIDLNEDYVKHHSLESGKEFIQRSSGSGTFSRAHYLYASKLLAGKTDCIVTGNFGSEIFRAMHVPGVMISPNLHAVFSSENHEEACRKVENSIAMQWLNQSEMQSEWEELRSDIAELPCFRSEYRDLSRNMQFYIFVFEEIFRKYFGAEMISQYGILRNRTPFLDIDFLRELMKTGFAGIHSEFFENNPVKRYKGQVLYAHIIRKAFPVLGRLPLDRGYRPDDLLSIRGLPGIVRGYIQKELRKRNSAPDPNRVKNSWEFNRNYYESLPVNELLFNHGKISHLRNQGFTDNHAMVYSMIYVDNYLNSK